MDNIIWSMQYTIISLMKKHEHFMLKKSLKLLKSKKSENDFWVWFKSFCIWFYMIEYDVYHRKTLFKVICMQSKLAKHSKYNEILRNTSKKKRKCKNTYPWNDALQSSQFACTIFLMFRNRIRAQNPQIKLIFTWLWWFYIFSFWYFFGLLEQNWNCHSKIWRRWFQ